MPATLCHLSRSSAPPGHPRGPALGVGLLLALCGCAVAAQPSTMGLLEQSSAARAGRSDPIDPPAAIEVTAERSSLLARAAPLARLDGRSGTDLASVTYRVWRSNGRAALGLGVGTLGTLVPSADGRMPIRGDPPQALVGAVPAVSLGVRYHVTGEHALFADASRATSIGAGVPLVYVGTKLGVEWKPAKTTLGLERGALGMQLESGYRVSLRVRRGGPSVYLRGQF